MKTALFIILSFLSIIYRGTSASFVLAVHFLKWLTRSMFPAAENAKHNALDFCVISVLNVLCTPSVCFISKKRCFFVNVPRNLRSCFNSVYLILFKICNRPDFSGKYEGNNYVKLSTSPYCSRVFQYFISVRTNLEHELHKIWFHKWH